MCRNSNHEKQHKDNQPSLLDKIEALKNEDWVKEWRKDHEGKFDDLGFDVTPSRECPDYSKDPWA